MQYTRTVKIFGKENNVLRVVNVIRDAQIDRQWMLELEPKASHYVKE